MSKIFKILSLVRLVQELRGHRRSGGYHHGHGYGHGYGSGGYGRPRKFKLKHILRDLLVRRRY